MSDKPPIEQVTREGEVYAIIARASMPRTGFNFVSRPEDSLQLGVNHYAAGGTVKPHMHLPLERQLINTLEVLHIDSGAAALVLYDEEKRAFYETQLVAGDTVVLMRGGHGLQILQETRIIEVKQGPYLGPAKDKVVF
jgi:hypothetical protein